MFKKYKCQQGNKEKVRIGLFRGLRKSRVCKIMEICFSSLHILSINEHETLLSPSYQIVLTAKNHIGNNHLFLSYLISIASLLLIYFLEKHGILNKIAFGIGIQYITVTYYVTIGIQNHKESTRKYSRK